MFVIVLLVTVIFLQLTHPIRLGLVLIAFALITGFLTGIVSGSFWFSYVLFLVFLGGVLVLFIYITSLASNEKFSFQWKELSILLFIGGVTVLMFGLYFLPSNYFIFSDLRNIVTSNINFTELLLFKLYRSTTYHLTLIIVFYLLFVLLVCASIVVPRSGALRNFG